MKATILSKRIMYIFLICMSFTLNSCDKLFTEPEEEKEEPKNLSELLSSKIAVAVIPGGVERINVTAKNKDYQKDFFSVSSQNPAIASVTQLDSTITVTGVGIGETKLVISSSSGLQEELPVNVYDLKVLDVGELLITYAYKFSYRWDDRGSGAHSNGNFYHPITHDGFFALGSIAFGGDYRNPDDGFSVMLVKAKPGSNALAHPTHYNQIWGDGGSGAHDDGSMWMPVPPPGYKAMGVVAMPGYNPPALTDVVCVREDLTISGEAGNLIWNDSGSGANDDFGCWYIEPPISGPHDNAYLSTGTFFGWQSWSAPGVHGDINVLTVELPMIAKTPYKDYVPELKGYDSPPAETVPVMAREMLVPSTILKDPLYNNNPMWKVINSPFYRLERQVYYKLMYHNHNQTSTEQNNKIEITSGVVKTESETFSRETSISITAETGVSIKAVEAKFSTTVTQSFGYSTTTSVAELNEKSITSTINTAPGKAAALWQRFNRYVLKRHNGTSLEPVASWEFGIDSYITDEYPNE